MESYIQSWIKTLRRCEQDDLKNKLVLEGNSYGKGLEWVFKDEQPCVAAYSHDELCDVVVLSVRIDSDLLITIIGDEKLNRGQEHVIDVNDIFVGELEYITSEIGRSL